jgi:hypothetical protein
MFLPLLFCETSVAYRSRSPGPLPQLLWILLTSQFYQPVITETSLGKGNILLPMPAVSTTKGLLVKGIVMLCPLTLLL